MTADGLPLIGLMLGDACGIGPEVAVKAMASGAVGDRACVAIVGDVRVLEQGMRDANLRFDYDVYETLDEVTWPRRSVPVVDLGNIDPGQVERGKVSPESGRACGETLKHMINLALAGALDIVCYASLNKAALHRGGWQFPDEAHMFADFAGYDGLFGEMNVIPEFSTFRVTSHVALRDAVDMITPDRLTAVVRLADRTLRSMGKRPARLGVAALNPHAGEQGLFGDEEIRIIRPAVERLQAEGIHATGPIPSDSVFLRAKQGEFDGVVMMYHDQGQIATKLLGFGKGVTVHVGLPVTLTTPAHGTAFDIIGQGVADPGGMEYALRLGARLAVRTAPAV
ncbi:MAG: 4-hydroxythreonine-4-phosphate dehydrogenase PdxA [Chloroflexota bacterium]|nr:4-hydroxythreonine-4-phosphate dehydrogenase PdxA [Chloroflexota bacterium]MDE2897884.1 4-hydroxythreonine-4-phosphate dehydrogenase PdxA [Chloroflexota bacterium]